MFIQNPSIRSKYIFLSLLQQHFSGHEVYTWNKDPRLTKIIIADKYAVEMGIAAKRPSIIIDRGPFSWTGSYRNEALPNDREPFRTEAGSRLYPRLSAERSLNYKLTDILRGSITFQIVTKEPYAADQLANEVFYVLTAYREWYKEKGLHKVDNLSVGRENIVRVDSAEVELTLVPVSLNFSRQESVILGERQFNARLYEDDKERFENIDFVFSPDGTQVELGYELPDGATLTLDYVDAITLQAVEGAVLVAVNGSSTLFNVPDNGVVYGYYKLTADISSTIT